MEINRHFNLPKEIQSPKIDKRLVAGGLVTTAVAAAAGVAVNNASRNDSNLPINKEALTSVVAEAASDPYAGDMVLRQIANNLVTQTAGINPDNYSHVVILSGPAERLPYTASAQNGPSQRYEVILSLSGGQLDQPVEERGPAPLNPVFDRGLIRVFDIPLPSWDDVEMEITRIARITPQSTEQLSQDFVIEEADLTSVVIYNPTPGGQRENIFALSWSSDSANTSAYIETDGRPQALRGDKPVVTLSIRSQDLSNSIEEINTQNADNTTLANAALDFTTQYFSTNPTNDQDTIINYGEEIMEIINNTR